MARKLKNAYMPKWMAWFMAIILLPLLIYIEYEAFFGKEPYPLMGALNGFMFIAIIVMMFVVSYKKIPYMHIGV